MSAAPATTIWHWARKEPRRRREYLASLGIAPDRLTTTSYGEEIPVVKRARKAVGGKIAGRAL